MAKNLDLTNVEDYEQKSGSLADLGVGPDLPRRVVSRARSCRGDGPSAAACVVSGGG